MTTLRQKKCNSKAQAKEDWVQRGVLTGEAVVEGAAPPLAPSVPEGSIDKAM
jgi:hypothetical protein